MKFVSHIEKNIDNPQDFLAYYRDMTKVLLIQAKKLEIPNQVIGILFLSAAIAFLRTHLKDPSKENILKHFIQACDNTKGDGYGL